MRGFFAIGIENCKTEHNVGSLWRSANLFGAAFIFTVGRRYKRQSSDTRCTPRRVPLIHFESIDDLHQHLPHGCPLTGVELSLDAFPLGFTANLGLHPQSTCYLLGAEDHGLSKKAQERCHQLVRLPGEHSMNVACAGSIVMYDRWLHYGGERKSQ